MNKSKPADVASVVGKVVVELVKELGLVEVCAEDLERSDVQEIVDAIRERNLTSAERSDDVGSGEDSRTQPEAAIRTLDTNNEGGDDMTCSAPAIAGNDGGWWLHGRVAQYLAVDVRTLKARMMETPEGIHRPWVNFGSAQAPKYRWQSQKVDTWWRRINQWRTSRDEGDGTGSAGAARPGNGAAGPARTRRPPTRSGGKLNKPSQKGGTGSLTAFVRSLPSKS